MEVPKNNKKIIKLLLARGADPTAQSTKAQTPHDLAKEQDFHAAAAILEKAELTHQLIKAGGETTKPTMVTIRFGGPQGAGKSTLTDALRVTRLRSFFRSENQEDEGATNMQRRTKGINCTSFTDEHSAEFAIFDLGGNGEFLASHQMFIGDGSVPVIDCVVVSALDECLEENALRWCSLFASRNQPAPTPWPLLLIATRADKASHEHQRTVFDAFRKIKQTFRNDFQFPLDRPILIDTRKSWSDLTTDLRRTLGKLHDELVNHEDLPRQPTICQRIKELLPALKKVTPAPVITKQKFTDFMRPRIGIKDEERSQLSGQALASLLDKALRFLTGYATVLSFSQTRAQDFVVIDPQWLLSDIVGRLMAERPLPGPYIHYENGYADKQEVVSALDTKHLPGETAFEMVAGLGFCLEQKKLLKVLNPSKLLAARPAHFWCDDPTMVVNAGRRLKCKGAVVIANAFFPYLQVHFYHHYLAEYHEKLPMWNGGIRLVAGIRTPAEALIEAHPANVSIDIIVRGRRDTERACAKLLHELTEETLRKASEISPGSQLRVFYLSKLELDKISPSGLLSRPCVEYSEEKVVHAVKHGHHVTDGDASSPEDPANLLVSLLPHASVVQRVNTFSPSTPGPSEFLARSLSNRDWMAVLIRLAKGVNSFKECDGLAIGLAVNDREGDFVRQLREMNPYRRPPEIATEIFRQWLQCGDEQ